jgi:hypothetical protein
MPAIPPTPEERERVAVVRAGDRVRVRFGASPGAWWGARVQSIRDVHGQPRHELHLPVLGRYTLVCFVDLHDGPRRLDLGPGGHDAGYAEVAPADAGAQPSSGLPARA